MVVSAERDTVVSIGCAAVLPGDDVVNVGLAWRAIAAGEGAAAVA